MASYEGDVIRAPGFEQINSGPAIEILYSTVGLLQKGGTLKPGSGIYPAGQAIKYDDATKRYEKADANADVIGFLRLPVDTGTETSLPKQGVFVMGGVIKTAHVVGVTADATLAGVLNGQYNAERGFLKF